MRLSQIAEGQTYRDLSDTRVVYHLDRQNEFKEVLKRQDIGL